MNANQYYVVFVLKYAAETWGTINAESIEWLNVFVMWMRYRGCYKYRNTITEQNEEKIPGAAQNNKKTIYARKYSGQRRETSFS